MTGSEWSSPRSSGSVRPSQGDRGRVSGPATRRPLLLVADWCGVAVRDAEGRAIRLMSGTIDITALKQAEEALGASEKRFRTFVDHASDAFFLQGDGGTILELLTAERARAWATRGTSGLPGENPV